MYVQGVSTRKVAAITAELCGLEVSSSQVSRAAALLDGELEACRKPSRRICHAFPLQLVPFENALDWYFMGALTTGSAQVRFAPGT